MRAQVIVLGAVERELSVELTEELLPGGLKRAEAIGWRVAGGGVEVAERLSRLGLTTAVLTGMGTSSDDRKVLSALRKRGVQTRGTRSSPGTTPMTIRLRTPGHDVRIATPTRWSPVKDALLRAIRGSRHLHVCGDSLADRRSLEATKSGLSRAQAHGASTSLDVSETPLAMDWRPIRSLLAHTTVLLGDSKRLRSLSETSRLAAAASSTLDHGVSAIAVRLGAGGCRIYSRHHATRVPSLGEEVDSPVSAFASGFLLGWLLGATPETAGILGATAALRGQKPKLPDRRELSSRLARARRDPLFRKLVPTLADAERLLDTTKRLPRRDLTRPNSRVTR